MQELLLTFSSADAHNVLRRINLHKAADQDNKITSLGGPSGHVLQNWLMIFLPSLTCFLHRPHSQLAFKPPLLSLSLKGAQSPVLLTTIIMKYFEKVVLVHIKSNIPESLDPLQCSCCPSRSTEDNISAALQTGLNKPTKNAYIRKLFIDRSSGFNAVLLHKLTNKVYHLGLNPTISSYISSLTGHNLSELKIKPQTL